MLEQVALAIFRPGNDIKIAQDNIPVLGQLLGSIPADTMTQLNEPSIWGAVIAIILMLGIAVTVIGRRVKPE